MKNHVYVLLAMTAWFGLSLSQAASVRIAPGADGKDRVILENDQVRLEVDPQRGARVDSFRFKPWGEVDIVRHKESQGLLLDHFWQESWPGQFWEATYTHQVFTNGPGEVAVRFGVLSVAKGVPGVADILLEKTLALREGDPTVQVTVRLSNQAPVARFVGYWLQNAGWLGGDQAGDRYFRPSLRGVSEVGYDDATLPDAGFIREPQAGWSAALDEKTRHGLVWRMDYNDLWFLYNCTPASTVEWQYEAVAIPPGKSWETRIAMNPIARMPSVDYVSARLLLGAAIAEDKAAGSLVVTLTGRAAGPAVKTLTVEAEIEALMTNRKQPGAPLPALANLGIEPQTMSVRLPYDTAEREPAVVRLTLKGETAAGESFTEKAELWYRGSMVENRNSTDGSPFYSIASQPKVRSLIRPERIARIVKDPPRVLFLKGLLAPAYEVEAALRALNPASEIVSGFMLNGVFGQQLDYFPYDYDVLMAFDLVILGDVSNASLGYTAVEMLKDYVRAGGNLLVLGGPFAYGNGGYGKTELETLLPVLSRVRFDVRKTGGALRLTAAGNSLPAAAVMALRPAYLHDVTVKPEAEVLVSCKAGPVVVRGKQGRGSVCCVVAAPLGDPVFTATPQWRDVLTALLRGLGMSR